jgi:hypothetical protein
MPNDKYDGVIEAVHYQTDGQVDWVRGYLRRGAAWGDRVILKRAELVKAIQAGKQMMIGQRVEFMAGTFNVSTPVNVTGPSGKENLVTTSSNVDHDLLEGVPVL